MAEHMDDGGYAFPRMKEEFFSHRLGGMSLRDYFAGQAIASIPLRSWDHVGGDDLERIDAWAKCAYLVADAMLLARQSDTTVPQGGKSE
jgi:hypothetical protein